MVLAGHGGSPRTSEIRDAWKCERSLTLRPSGPVLQACFLFALATQVCCPPSSFQHLELQLLPTASVSQWFLVGVQRPA